MKRTHIEIMTQFLEGLNDATAAASQNVHHFNNMKWMAVRDMLNIIRDGYAAQTVKNVQV